MPLFRPMPPMHDESLAGLVARAAGTNMYERTSDILAFINLGRQHPESIAFTSADSEQQLAELLGIPVESITKRFHRRLDRNTVDFFGVAVRDVFIERLKRRVSPVGLSALPYARAIWQIRTFDFDPATLDPLVSQCPECRKDLGFKVTQGIEFCDHCREETSMGFDVPSVDLRQIKQSPFVVEDREALDFVTGLLDPAIAEIDNSVLPSELSALSRGALFEIVHTIAAAIKMNAEGKLPRKLFSRSEVGAINPQHLAAAGRAILDYPQGYSAVLREAASTSASRPGEWGYLKAFGALSRVHRDKYFDRKFAQKLVALLDDTLARSAADIGTSGKGAARPEKFVPLRTLKDTTIDNQGTLMRLAEHPKTHRMNVGVSSKAPVLLHRSQAHMTLIQYKDQVPFMTAALKLGIPPDALRDMVHRRHMFIYTGTSSEIRPVGTYMSGRNLDSIIERLTAGREPTKPSAIYCSFTEAMLMFPAGRRPWVPLLERMLDGQIEYLLHKTPSKGILRAISVAGVSSIRDELMEEQSAMPPPKIQSVSAGSACLMLGISVHDAYLALVSAQHLKTDDEGAIPYSEVLSFGERFIFANEIGMRGQRSAQLVRAWMKVHHVQPAFDFNVKCGLIYHRADVEPLLGMAAETSNLRDFDKTPA